MANPYLQYGIPSNGQSAVENNMMSVGSNRLHTCKVCGHIFTHTGHFKRHMMIHTGEKPFSCTVCGKAFSRKDTLKSHYLSHST